MLQTLFADRSVMGEKIGIGPKLQMISTKDYRCEGSCIPMEWLMKLQIRDNAVKLSNQNQNLNFLIYFYLVICVKTYKV